MGILAEHCRELPGTEAGYDSDGHVTAVRNYQMAFDAKVGPLTAIALSGFQRGQLYQTEYESHPLARCTNVSARLSEERGKNFYKFVITANYSSNGPTHENPCEEEPIVSGGFIKKPKLMQRDSNNKPVMNPAKDPYDIVPEIEDVMTVIRYVRNEPGHFNRSKAKQFMLKRNEGEWNGEADGTVLITDLGYENKSTVIGSGEAAQLFKYCTVNYEFAIDSTMKWRIDLLACGYNFIDLGNKKKPCRVKKGDASSDKVSSPARLGEDGEQLGDSDPTYWDEYEPFGKVDFSSLGIVV